MRTSSISSAILAISVAIGGFAEAAAAAPVPASVSGVLDINVVNTAGEVRIVRRGDNMYFNGRRGYRTHRSGYRQYNGFWFPSEAFVGMLIINGMVQRQRPVYGNNSHVRWCINHYRSYQISTDTYQPYMGGRRHCNSPFN